VLKLVQNHQHSQLVLVKICAEKFHTQGVGPEQPVAKKRWDCAGNENDHFKYHKLIKLSQNFKKDV
jgi:hypothetical protein